MVFIDESYIGIKFTKAKQLLGYVLAVEVQKILNKNTSVISQKIDFYKVTEPQQLNFSNIKYIFIKPPLIVRTQYLVKQLDPL